MGRMTDDELDIRPVTDDEAGELLTLRRAAFVTEAQLIGDVNIPPLTQTLDELRADLARADVVTLGAWAGHRLVASIRVLVEGTKATLGSTYRNSTYGSSTASIVLKRPITTPNGIPMMMDRNRPMSIVETLTSSAATIVPLPL